MSDNANHGAGRSISVSALARLLPAVVLLVVLVLFVFANTQKVKIDFIVAPLRIPLILVLAGTAVVGALLAALIGFRRRHN